MIKNKKHGPQTGLVRIWILNFWDFEFFELFRIAMPLP